MSLFRKRLEPRVAPVSVAGAPPETHGVVRAVSGTTATVGLVVWALEAYAFRGPDALPLPVYVFVQWVVPAAGGLLVGAWHRRRTT